MIDAPASRDRVGREWKHLPKAEAALAPTRKRLAESRMAVASPSGYDRRRFRPFRGRRRGAGAFYRPPLFLYSNGSTHTYTRDILRASRLPEVRAAALMKSLFRGASLPLVSLWPSAPYRCQPILILRWRRWQVGTLVLQGRTWMTLMALCRGSLLRLGYSYSSY